MKYRSKALEYTRFLRITPKNWLRYFKLSNKKVTPKISEEFAKISQYRVACILDEFSFDSFSPEAKFLQLEPHNWQQSLTEFKPNLILIESVWKGKNNSWNRKVSKMSNELIELLYWASQNDIPTVFWHKEVPPHFSTFLRVTKMFDHIFLTDADCILRYRKKMGHDRVYFLPFACQPKIHHPIQDSVRKDAIIYAGSFYPEYKYPERYRNFIDLYDGLSKFEEIDIYDRNANKGIYPFPKQFEKYIKGSLPFSEMCKAYRSYEYGLNMNSVKDSSTMCSRRVFELIASNTFVVGNFSQAVKNFFGDSTLCSDSKDEIIGRFKEIHNDENLKLKLKLQALRRVMDEHTYKSRFTDILQKIGVTRVKPSDSVLVIALTQNSDESSRVRSYFDSQTHPHKKLVFKDDIINNSELVSSCEFIAVFHPKEFYGEHYLADMASAFQYSQTEVVTKKTIFYKNDQGLQVSNPDSEYRLVNKIVPSASMATREFYGAHMDEFLTNKMISVSALSIDRFNFCSSIDIFDMTQNDVQRVSDLQLIDSGKSIRQIWE